MSFQYIEGAFIQSVSPIVVSASTDVHDVLLEGTQFTTKVALRIGGITVIPVVLSENLLRASFSTVSFEEGDILDIDVSDDGFNFHFSGFSMRVSPEENFEAAPDASVTFSLDSEQESPIVSPDVTSLVTLRGHGFSPDIHRRCFWTILGSDTAHSTVADVISDELIDCHSPSSPGDILTYLSLGVDDYEESGALSLESYSSPPSVDSVYPMRGPSTGQTVISLSGLFHNISSISCVFGDVFVPAVFVDSTYIHCTSPSQSYRAGTSVELAIAYGSRVFTPSNFSFLYDKESIIATISPSFGPRTSNTMVTINGENFPDTSVCKMDGHIIATSYISPWKIQCFRTIKRYCC